MANFHNQHGIRQNEGASPTLIDARTLMKLGDTQTPVIMGNLQVEVIVLANGFRMLIDVVGRSLERLECEFNSDGILQRVTNVRQRLSPGPGARTEERADDLPLRPVEMLLKRIEEQASAAASNPANASKCRFHWSGGAWIDVGEPCVALHSATSAHGGPTRIDKHQLCYPILDAPGKIASDRSSSRYPALSSIGELLALPATDAAGCVAPLFVPTISLRALKDIAREEGLTISLKGDPIPSLLEIKDLGGQTLDARNELPRLIYRFWDEHTPKVLKTHPEGMKMSSPHIEYLPPSVVINSFADLVRALSVSGTPLSETAARDLSSTILQITRDTPNRTEAAERIATALRSYPQALDVYDREYLLKYAYSLSVGDDPGEASDAPLTVTFTLHTHGSPLDAAHEFRHYYLTANGADSSSVSPGPKNFRVSYQERIHADKDAHTTSAAIARALNVPLAHHGVSCTFPVSTSIGSEGQQYWIPLGALAQKLGLSDVDDFIALAVRSLNPPDGVASCIIESGSYSFAVVPRLQGLHSTVGYHEIKPGFVGQIESSSSEHRSPQDASLIIELLPYGRTSVDGEDGKRALDAALARITDAVREISG